MLKIVLLVVSFALPWPGSSTHAAYGRTEWGMPLSLVQRLYPGGRLSREADGTTDYWVVRPAAGVATAMVQFGFGAAGALGFVNVQFPEQGTKVDLERETYTASTKERARALMESLAHALSASHGRPVEEHGRLSWTTSAGDMIMLSVRDDDDAHATVSLFFKPLALAAPQSDWL